MSTNSDTRHDLKESQVDTREHSTQDQPPSYVPNIVPAESQPGTLTTTAIPTFLPLPAIDATAPEIRAYITWLLQMRASFYALSSADITHKAQKWRYGTGRELREYNEATWQGMFGMEVGMVLHSAVEHAIGVEEKIRQSKSYVFEIIWMVASVVVPPATIPLFRHLTDLSPPWKNDLIAWAVPAVLGTLVFLSCLYILYEKRSIRRQYPTHPAFAKGKHGVAIGDDETIELEEMATV